jgi:AcrR family transcriptional regulator
MFYTPRMSTAKSRRDQFSEATRAALLDAATRRFADHGFAGTTLEDVAADIQATRGAVYHHFASKKALFEAVFEKLETEAVELSAAAGEKGTDPWSRALLALDAFLEKCCDPDYGRIVWEEAAATLGMNYWKTLEEKFAYGLIEHYVKDLVDSGMVAPVPIDAATNIAFHLLGAAGEALASAPEERKRQVMADYRQVIAKMLAGLAAK